jgi:hypothetical protein
MRAATLAHQAVEDLVLAVLRDAEGFPLSTAEVADKAGPAAHPVDATCWKRLDALARRGLAERVKLPGNRQVYWRAAS